MFCFKLLASGLFNERYEYRIRNNHYGKKVTCSSLIMSKIRRYASFRPFYDLYFLRFCLKRY